MKNDIAIIRAESKEFTPGKVGHYYATQDEKGEISISYANGFVTVKINNAAQACRRTPGRTFDGWKDAVDHYKTDRIKSAILLVRARINNPLPRVEKKTTKTAIVSATDALNYRRDSVTGGTRDEVRRQFEYGSGFDVLEMANIVEALLANPSKRVDDWTLRHARESIQRARDWFERMAAEPKPEPSAPTPEERRAAFVVVG